MSHARRLYRAVKARINNPNTNTQRFRAWLSRPKQIARTVGVGFFVAVILASGIIAPLSHASALNKTADQSPSEMAKSFAYYKALRNCMTSTMWKNKYSLLAPVKDSMSQQNAIDYEWFWARVGPLPTDQPNAVNVGVINDPRNNATSNAGDGRQNCGDSEGKAWISKAVAMWGFGSGPEFLCALGNVTRQTSSTGTPCTDTTAGNNDFYIVPGIELALDAMWSSQGNFSGSGKGFGNTGTGTDSIGAGEYKLYLDSFLSQCAPTEVKTGGVYTIKGLATGGTSKDLVDVHYAAASSDRGLFFQVSVYEGVGKSCGELTTLINDFDKTNLSGDRAVVAYAKWLKTHDIKDENTGTNCTDSADNSNSCETQTSCAIDTGAGWIICPVLGTLGTANDAMYGWIETILVLNPLQMEEAGQPTAQYLNWQAIRDIANVLLVIAFLFVIFSQATSIGISNYGIKKMLPRIIMVAIGINVSYFLMMVAIDITNLLGVGLHNLLSGLAVNDENLNYSNIVGSWLTGTAAVGIGSITAIAALGATSTSFTTLLLISLPFVAVAALSLLAAVATLFLRNALVVVLVIIAPVAIAAYILPNTQEWFTKWRKLLISMLMLFPMAALMFAGAKFAAHVVLSSNTPLAPIAALFIMAAPLGALPFLIKSSNSILAGVNNRLQSLAKSAKNPLQKALNPAVQASRAKYGAGATNIFGRKRPGEVGGDGIRRRTTGPRAGEAYRRNLGQTIGDRRRTLEDEAKGYGAETTENYRQGALEGRNRRGREAIERIERQGHRATTTSEGFGAELEVEKADASTVVGRRELQRKNFADVKTDAAAGAQLQFDEARGKAPVAGTPMAVGLAAARINQPDLQQRAVRQRAFAQAQQTATDKITGNYTKALEEDPTLLRIAGGTVDDAGRLKATAYGEQAAGELAAKNVKAAESLIAGNAAAAAVGGLETRPNPIAGMPPVVGFTSYDASGVESFIQYDEASPTSADSQAVVRLAKEAGIIGQGDTNLDGFSIAGRKSLAHVQDFKKTPFGAKAIASNLFKQKQATASNIEQLVQDIVGDTPQETAEMRAGAVEAWNAEAAAAGMDYLSKSLVDSSGRFILGGQKGGVAGTIKGLIDDKGLTAITKQLMDDPAFAAEAGRQMTMLMFSPDQDIQNSFNEKLPEVSDKVIDQMAKEMGGRPGVGTVDEVRTELLRRRTNARNRNASATAAAAAGGAGAPAAPAPSGTPPAGPGGGGAPTPATPGAPAAGDNRNYTGGPLDSRPEWDRTKAPEIADIVNVDEFNRTDRPDGTILTPEEAQAVYDNQDLIREGAGDLPPVPSEPEPIPEGEEGESEFLRRDSIGGAIPPVTDRVVNYKLVPDTDIAGNPIIENGAPKMKRVYQDPNNPTNLDSIPGPLLSRKEYNAGRKLTSEAEEAIIAQTPALRAQEAAKARAIQLAAMRGTTLTDIQLQEIGEQAYREALIRNDDQPTQ